MDTLTLTHEPFVMVDPTPTEGKSVRLYALWEQPSADTSKLFGRQVEPTPLPTCAGCIWRNCTNPALGRTCTGMHCDKEIGAYKREPNDGPVSQGYQIGAEATLTLPDEHAKAIFLRGQTAISTSPGQDKTNYLFDPTLPCAQKTEVTAQLAK